MPTPHQTKSELTIVTKLELCHHDDLISDSEHPAMAKAEQAVEALRKRHGEIKEVLTTEIQEQGIYANPQIFALFDFLRTQGAEPGELDFLLSQFTRNVELPYGGRVFVLGSGWGITGRRLAEKRPDLKITHVDINEDISTMDRLANRVQGFAGIESVVADATDIRVLRNLFGDKPVEVASVGLVRYLSPEQRRKMVTSLLDFAPKGSMFVMREVNWQTMSALQAELETLGVGYIHEQQETPHLRYTRIFTYYYMYNQWEPITSAIKEIDPDFDFEEFRKQVDELKERYPNIDSKKIFGDGFDLGDLRHLLVLADLAGFETKKEEVLIFHN